MKYLLLLILFSCADITPEGRKIHIVETEGDLLNAEAIATKFSQDHGCKFVEYLDARTSMFPGSYSIHDTEVHTALKNRAAKVGANVVVANFYRKPAQGVALLCPEENLSR